MSVGSSCLIPLSLPLQGVRSRTAGGELHHCRGFYFLQRLDSSRTRLPGPKGFVSAFSRLCLAHQHTRSSRPAPTPTVVSASLFSGRGLIFTPACVSRFLNAHSTPRATVRPCALEKSLKVKYIALSTWVCKRNFLISDSPLGKTKRPRIPVPSGEVRGPVVDLSILSHD